MCCIAGPVENDKHKTKNGDFFDKPRKEKSQGRRKIYIELH
jgi:hypothetical protein